MRNSKDVDEIRDMATRASEVFVYTALLVYVRVSKPDALRMLDSYVATRLTESTIEGTFKENNFLFIDD